MYIFGRSKLYGVYHNKVTLIKFSTLGVLIFTGNNFHDFCKT